MHKPSKNINKITKVEFNEEFNKFCSQISNDGKIYNYKSALKFELVEQDMNQNDRYVLSFCEKHGYSCHFKSSMKCCGCLNEKHQKSILMH